MIDERIYFFSTLFLGSIGLNDSVSLTHYVVWIPFIKLSNALIMYVMLMYHIGIGREWHLA